MSSTATIVVYQPHAHDIVEEPIKIAGVATGFEAVIQVRVRDGHGNQLAHTPLTVGANGVMAHFKRLLRLGSSATLTGMIDLFEESARDGSEIHKVTVPVVFGRALLDPYHGFVQHTVVQNETLIKIAQKWYNDGSKWRRIYDANRHQISNPDLIVTGQVLRVPM